MGVEYGCPRTRGRGYASLGLSGVQYAIFLELRLYPLRRFNIPPREVPPASLKMVMPCVVYIKNDRSKFRYANRLVMLPVQVGTLDPIMTRSSPFIFPSLFTSASFISPGSSP